ncbi:MAG: hypothetical protein WC554_16610 [Clostridia bacterium]|jgi:hypothetical protein
MITRLHLKYPIDGNFVLESSKHGTINRDGFADFLIYFYNPGILRIPRENVAGYEESDEQTSKRLD